VAVTLVAMSVQPLIRRWTVDDIDAFPHGDGNRYEIINGGLFVTGLPMMRHQRAIGRLCAALDAACPADLEVVLGPFAVVLADDTVMQPDLLVARATDLVESELPAPPVLAVEVLSVGSRSVDLGVKPGRLARAGTAAYWVFDPDHVRLWAWELVDGAYREVADVRGEEAYTAGVPYPVTVVPAALVR
jgi:Uma2 family endonuclease